MNRIKLTTTTTYFYWPVTEGKKSKNLKRTNYLNPATRCIVIPYDLELLPVMLHQCLYFSVETDWKERTVTISYYIPKYEALKEKYDNYITTLGNIETEKISLICNVDHMNFSDTTDKLKVETSFSFNLPEPVMKFALSEIRKVQQLCFGFKPEKFAMKEHTDKYLFYSNDLSIVLNRKRKVINEELIKACVSYPSSPIIYYYIKHYNAYSSAGSVKLEPFENSDFCCKDDLKHFFASYGIKYSKRFVNKTSTWWMRIPDLFEVIEFGFTDKKVIYYLMKHMNLLMEFRCPSGREMLKESISRKGDRFTKNTLVYLTRMKMVVPEDLWPATRTEILNRKR